MCQVLIVAKCNVNVQFIHLLFTEDFVLIVAKCNVNIRVILADEVDRFVLIVAKCNVNSNYKYKMDSLL